MRRKPTALKQLEGTLRRDRVNVHEPRPPKAAGLLPRRGLTLGVRGEYKFLVEQLTPMGVLTVSDVSALEVTAAAGDEYWRHHRVVARRGATYTTVNAAGSKMVRARPEVAMMADAWRRFCAGLQHFGLTPASRPKVEGSDTPPVPERPRVTDPSRDPSRFFRDARA